MIYKQDKFLLKKELDLYVIIFNIILLSVFFLPLNGLFYYKKYLGELYAEGSCYFLYIAAIFFIFSTFRNWKIRIPEFKGFFIVILLLIYFVFSGIVNLPDIFASYFKNRSGIEKFLLQFMVLSFCIFCSIMFYNVFMRFPVDYVFNNIRKAVVFSFMIILIWGIIEFLEKFTNLNVNILSHISCLIHKDIKQYPDRLRFICGEPSWYGIYLSFAFPFLLVWIDTRRKIWFYLFFYLIIFLSYFAFSRTVAVILTFEALIFILLNALKIKRLKETVKKTVFLFLPVFLAFNLNIFNVSLNYFRNNLRNNPIVLNDTPLLKTIYDDKGYFENSNKTRKSMQIIGFKMGLDNLFFGVGLGQFGFHFVKYVSKDMSNNIEIRDAMNTNTKSWPSVHGLYARLFAEGGIFALVIWLFLWWNLFFSIFKRYLTCRDDNICSFYFTVLIVILGLMLLGFTADSFRFMGYWYILGLCWFLLDKENEKTANLH